MKRSTKHLFQLLAIYTLLSVASSTECEGFLDGSQCVALCTPPKVNDEISGTCIENRAACTGFYFTPDNSCLHQCPQSTIPPFSETEKQDCFPISFLMEFPQVATLTCTDVQYLDLINGQCSPNTTPCSGVLIPQIFICLAQCPQEYQQAAITTSAGQTIQACTIKPYIVPAQCTSTQIRDVQTNTCLDDVSSCVGFFLEEMMLCLASCPYGSGTPKVVENATYQICTSAETTCTEGEVMQIHNDTVTCLASLSDCTSFYIEDRNLCADACPQYFRSKAVTGESYQLCQFCPVVDEKGTCYEKCPSNLVLDVQKQLCVTDSSDDCDDTQYFAKQLSMCVEYCPFGTAPNNSTTPKTCVPCGQTSVPCPDQSNLCTEYLSADKKECDIECPILQYAMPQADGQSYRQCQNCTSTSQFVANDGSACVDNCGTDYIGDRATRKCILMSECTEYVFTVEGVTQCGRTCPSNQIAGDPIDGQDYILCSACQSGTFLDKSTGTCVETCTIFDATKTFCLKSIADCVGYITSDQLTCNPGCPEGEVSYAGAVSGQFICSKSCPDYTYLSNKSCLRACLKGTYADQSSMTCVETSKCPYIVSFDGKNCVAYCDVGQFVQTDSKTNVKSCKICNEKISADGTKCAKECGASEVFDTDMKKCLDSNNANTCANKIYSTDGKTCSSKCPKGQLTYTDPSSNMQKCLASPASCTNIISSDLKSCVSACQATEAVITEGSTRICRVCPYGANSDKTACNTSSACDASTQLFDLDLGTCVAIADCASKLLSVDGLKCSAKCVYPQVTRLAVSTTQCYASCGTDEINVKGKGCVASTECTGYISAATGACVEECIYVREAIDSTTSVPKTCKTCDSSLIPTVVVSGSTKVISCEAQTSSDTTVQTTGMSDILGMLAQIEPEDRENVRTQVTSVGSTVDTAISSLRKNQELTDDERNTAIKAYIADLRAIAKSYSNKVQQTTGSTDNESQVNLGSTEFSMQTETLKDGNVFKVKFSMSDFIGSSPPSFQIDPSTLGTDDLVDQASSDIGTLQATNQSTNPYCEDSTKCSSYGLFSIDYTLADGSRRRLSVDDGQTFSAVYNVSADEIENTICVTYDEDTGEMTPSVSTTTDTTNLTVTCSFYTNTDLYLDSSCTYIDESYCSITTPISKIETSNSSAAKNVFSTALFALLVVLLIH